MHRFPDWSSASAAQLVDRTRQAGIDSRHSLDSRVDLGARLLLWTPEAAQSLPGDRLHLAQILSEADAAQAKRSRRSSPGAASRTSKAVAAAQPL